MDFDAAVALLCRLIATPSPSREEGAAADIMEAELRRLGYAPRRKGNNVWAEAAPWVASVSARAGEVFEQAEDSALAFTAFPRAHWAKLRTNNVQERANREIKRRYRVVQSFPSRESMLRLTCASLMETEGQWSQQRVFSEASAAEGFAEPADRPAPTEGRRRALGRRAREIVDEIVEKRGLKKE